MKKVLAVLLTALLLMQALPALATPPLQKGQYVSFGTYDQDNNTGNGKEPIQWMVLDVQGSKVLLLSVYVLDAHEYHNNTDGVLWNNSNLRNWLNNTFVNGAFSAQEKNAIVPFVQNTQGTTYTAKVEIDDRSGASIWKDVKRSDRLIKLVTGKMVTVTGAEVKNDNYKYVPVTYKENGKTYTGYMESRFLKLVAYETVEVNDKVTILSKTEVQKYLGSNSKASPTGTAYAKGVNGKLTGCWWWTRDEKKTEKQVPVIGTDSRTSTQTATEKKGGVRPSLWVDTNKVTLNGETAVMTTNTPKPTAVPTPTPKPTATPTPKPTQLSKNQTVTLDSQELRIKTVKFSKELSYRYNGRTWSGNAGWKQKHLLVTADWVNASYSDIKAQDVLTMRVYYQGKEYWGTWFANNYKSDPRWLYLNNTSIQSGKEIEMIY